MLLSPTPIQKFFNNNGEPMAGGLLYTYAAGTSDKIATYKNQAGSEENTNPIVLDFRGECRLWIDPNLSYKYVLSPPGDTDPPTNPIWTVDNISAGSGGGGGASEPVEITFASTTEIDCSASDTFYGLLSNLVVSTLTLSNPTNGQRLKIMVLVSGETGMTYPANWVWANDTPAAEQLTSDRLHEFDMTYLEGPGGAWPPGDFWYVKYTVFYGWQV